MESGPGRWLRQACETQTVDWFSLRPDDDSDSHVTIEAEVQDSVPLRIHRRDDDSVTFAGVHPLAWRRAIADRDATQGDDASTVLKALIRAGIAESTSADVFATADPYLLSDAPGRDNMNVFDVHESLALIGLYQRLSFDQVKWRESPQSKVSVASSLCRQVAVEQHIRSFEPWMEHCVQIAQRTGSQESGDLARGFRARLASAIGALDTIRGRHQAGQGELGGDWQAEIESLILFVWSAFDVLAHATDRQFRLRTTSSNIGWQKRKWRKKLPGSPRGEGLASAASRLLPTVNTLFKLRNGIHRSPRSEGGYITGPFRTESVLMLTDEEIKLFDHLNVTPWWSRGNWSDPDGPQSTWMVAAVPFVEHIFRMSLNALDELLVHLVLELPATHGRSPTPHFVEPEEDRRRLAALVGLDGLSAS